MTTLSYRNRSGRVVAMPSYAVTEARHNFGKLMRAVSRKGAIAITHRDEPAAVLLSVTEYQSLVATGNNALKDIITEFDAILAQMQPSEVGAESMLNAAPSRLRRAARSVRKQR